MVSKIQFYKVSIQFQYWVPCKNVLYLTSKFNIFKRLGRCLKRVWQVYTQGRQFCSAVRRILRVTFRAILSVISRALILDSVETWRRLDVSRQLERLFFSLSILQRLNVLLWYSISVKASSKVFLISLGVKVRHFACFIGFNYNDKLWPHITKTWLKKKKIINVSTYMKLLQIGKWPTLTSVKLSLKRSQITFFPDWYFHKWPKSS